MIKNCEICGREFVARRSTARYCSDTCRSRAYRGTYAMKLELKPPYIGVSMTLDEVQDVVVRAHDVASDLSRAALLTPSPLCIKLKNVSRKLTDALRSEEL